MHTEDARTAGAAMVLRCLILEDQVMFGQLLTTMLQPVRDLAVVGMARTVSLIHISEPTRTD